MGILSGLFHSRDKPINSLNGSGYRFFLGQSTSGKPVNERSAMQMTAVYACVRILSEAIAGLPVHLYQYREDGSKEKALKHPLHLQKWAGSKSVSQLCIKTPHYWFPYQR